jgi:hypothetical protein
VDKQIVPLRWPRGGIDRRFGYLNQPQGENPTTQDALNVRPDSAGVPSSATQADFVRERGGSRPGLGKAFSTALGSPSPIKGLQTVQWVESDTLKSRLVAICNGTLYEEEPAGTMALAGTPGTLNSAKTIQMAERNQILYIADHADSVTDSAGTYQPKKFNPATSAVSNWTASLGTIPYGCPCICTWSDRLVLAGGTTTPFGVFCSRQSDPEDWDYSEEDSGAAVSLTLAEAGQIGDTINCLSPHSDKCLIIGCSTTLWIMRGDPGQGGQVDNLSQHVGVLDKGAWCTTPDGMFVFLSNDGLYAVPAGCSAGSHGFPKSISRERIPEELLAIDKAAITVSLAYDVRDRGIHIFLTPNTAGSSSATHWWFDWEAKSFWKVTLGSANFEPLVAHARRNYTPASSSESTVVFGCRDGYIRRFENDLNKDDSVSYSSYVLIGPIGDPALLRETVLDRVNVVLARDSGKVLWTAVAGSSPEEALNAPAMTSGQFAAGFSSTIYPKVRGQSIYLRISNLDGRGWGFEGGQAIISHRGRVRA